MPISVNGANGITFADGSIQNTGAAGFGFKNRIINGAMVIDQRNAGASVSISSNIYSLDRYRSLAGGSPTGVYSVQQSSVAPAGFTKSMLMTVTTAASSLAAANYYSLRQSIEGYNIADLGWGTASAKTATLSFWVRSSLTGTFGGAVNNDNDASYAFTYTISTANTWERKTITITGATVGTWATDNTLGLNLELALGVGSTRSGTAGVWTYPAAVLISATGATNVMATSGATFYITGIQLEVGNTATSFDYRSYGHELQLCQRYYEHTYDIGVAAGTATENGWAWIGSDIPSATTTGTLQSQGLRFETRKRTQPSMTVWDATGAVGKATRYYIGSGPSNNHTCTTDLITTNSFRVFIAGTSTTTNGAFHWAANAEL